ncbi:MAG: hypothetical protein ACOC1D_04990 [Prolixibacteraceae bacterium]
MSEHITHVAVYEDLVRLMNAASDQFPEAFLASTEKSYDSGLICSGARGNHLYAVPILEKYKNRKPESLGKKETEQIAGAIGWITHRASDLQMKPMFGILEERNHPFFYDDECQMFCDAIVFKEVYQGGKVLSESPYQAFSPATLAHGMKGNPAAEYMNVPMAENVFTHYFMKELVSLQQFIGDIDDINQYCDLLISNSQNLYENLRIYIDAFQNPDPQKLIDYIYNFNVYDSQDSLIQIVRDIQLKNEYPADSRLKEALETSENQSQYAQSLKMGYDFLFGAGQFYEGKISKPEVYDVVQNFNEAHRI